MYCAKHTRMYRSLEDNVDMQTMASDQMSHLQDADDDIMRLENNMVNPEENTFDSINVN